MSDDLVERVARAMARNQGDDFDQLPMGKSEWTASRGYFAGRFRDINEPMKSDYLDMAEAAIEAIEAAGHVVVPREPTEKMWDGWRSVNCRRGGYGFEEFTYFSGDYGNWVACYQAMIDAALEKDKANVG